VALQTTDYFWSKVSDHLPLKSKKSPLTSASDVIYTYFADERP